MARKGDVIAVNSPRVGGPPREGEIIEVLEGNLRVQYRVRWNDGHESLFAPAAGAARIEPARKQEETAARTTEPKKSMGKASTAKGTTATKIPGEKTTGKKSTLKTTTTRKSPDRKVAAKKAMKSAARKSPDRKVAAKKTMKSAARKSPDRKVAAKKATSRGPSGRR